MYFANTEISNFPPRRQAPGAAVQRQLTVSAPASCLLKVVTRISQKEEKDNRTKKNLLCKTNQESEQATTNYIQLFEQLLIVPLPLTTPNLRTS